MSTHDQDQRDKPDRPEAGRSDSALRRIGEALHGLKYGSVLAIVQDGVVVQIERTEKTRLGK
jgi:hypothetical protein